MNLHLGELETLSQGPAELLGGDRGRQIAATMVKSASQWSRRDLGIFVGMVALLIVSIQHGFGIPVGMLLLCVAPFVFGRDKWDGEVSAYSVMNSDGRRIAGTFTAEQFDAQLRGGPRPDDAPAAATMPRAPEPDRPAAPEDPAARRRLALEAAERRAKAAAAAS